MKKGKLILTTLCCLVGLGCFSCIADELGSGNITRQATTVYSGHNYEYTISKNYCFQKTASSNTIWIDTGSGEHTISQYNLYCYESGTHVKIGNTSTSNLSIYIYDMNSIVDYGIDLGTGQCPSCPDQYTSLECQSEYSLIPISSVDQSYCVNNNLCPSGGGGECESGSVNWSSIYVNNIQHIGKPNIFITIPEEIDWDYTNNTGSFDLDIIGYNVDYEKMSDILEVQNYKPSSEDFTNLVGLLAPYMSILVFALFCFIVIKRLKKPFSSKLK